jgi:hypothetical protein
MAGAARGGDHCGGSRSPRRSRRPPDLQAEEVGILLGAREGGLDEPRAKPAAQLLIAADADESVIHRMTARTARLRQLRDRLQKEQRSYELIRLARRE